MSFLGFHRHGESGEDDSRPPEAHPRWEAALTGETEAFLEGRIVEHLLAAGRVVPTWAVLNKVAHASPTELADLVETGGIPGNTPLPREPAYRAAQRRLACRLLACGAVPDEITRIQQTVLVPLELCSSNGPRSRPSPSDKPSEARAMRLTTAAPMADDDTARDPASPLRCGAPRQSSRP